MDNLLSFEDVQRQLGITPRQIRTLIDKRELPYIKITGRVRRIKESDLQSYINNNRFCKSIQ